MFHLPSFNISNDIWREAQFMQLFKMQLSPPSHYFIPLGPKYCPQHLVFEDPQFIFLLTVRDEASHPQKLHFCVLLILS
jgi:hypothetical protein